MSGMTKGQVVRQLRKEAALISDYVVLNAKVRGCIRVDNDMNFESWNDVHNWLFWLLEEGTIPFLPHLAVCKRSVDGSVVRPHFFILLPVGDEVHWDKRKRGGQRGLFRAVANGWTRALRGDPGGIKNLLKIKSPTAPRMLVGSSIRCRYASWPNGRILGLPQIDDRRAATGNSGLQSRSRTRSLRRHASSPGRLWRSWPTLAIRDIRHGWQTVMPSATACSTRSSRLRWPAGPATRRPTASGRSSGMSAAVSHAIGILTAFRRRRTVA